MSRPRKPYGPHVPGRLMATMIKVLAAEMSDQGRLSRGKRYWADDAVIDIVIGHGAVTAEIQGSRREPYVVTIEASGGSGVPTRSEVWVQCTCPDDTGSGGDACKHAVAAMFALSDEVAIDPTLIDRWRAGRRLAADGVAPVTELSTRLQGRVEDDEDDDDEDEGDGYRSVDDDSNVIELRPGSSFASFSKVPAFDELAALLRSPTGGMPPTFPDPERIDHHGLRDRLLAEVLNDALDHLELRWE